MAANDLKKDKDGLGEAGHDINDNGGMGPGRPQGTGSFFAKYKKFFAAGAVVVVLGIVIANISPSTSGKDTPDGSTVGNTSSVDGQDVVQNEEFKIDAYPEVNELVEKYYEYYASGDIDGIEQIVYPISDTEKSYIKIYSEYVEKYENIECYTKSGISDGEYMVSVLMDLKFKDIDTLAPSLGFFYVRKNEDGDYYVDNAYGEFNSSYQIYDTERGINTLITELEQQEDCVELRKKVENNFTKALSSDDDLNEMITVTIQNAIRDWVADLGTDLPAEGDTKTDDTKTDDTKTDDQEPEKTDDDKKDDEGDKDKGRTAYTSTKVNLREKQSINSDVVKTLKAGRKITVYGKAKNGWLKVEAGDVTGYIKEDYVVSEKPEEKKPKTDKTSKEDNDTDEKVSKRTAYAKTKVNMRKRRSTNSDVVKTLKAGTKVTVYGKSKNGWLKVEAKGKSGYIRKEYIVSDRSKVEKEDTSQNTPATPAYFNEGDRITLTDSVNVRVSMSESADRVGLAYKGDVLTVIMSYAEGWTKVSWNGETGYVKTEYLK